MQNSARPQPQSDRFAPRDAALLAIELRRKGWEVLSDLGLSDEEIADYYREPHDAAPGARPAPVQ